MNPVLVEADGPVLWVRLNRPDRLNAVSEQLYRDLLEHLRGADVDPDIRAVVLTGAGRAFCVGADLKDHHAGTRTAAQRAEYVELAWQVCAQIQRMGTPVIAAVAGYALGAGAEMATSADFLVVADDAVMGFPEVSVGTFVGGGVTRRLPRLVGLRRATELLLLGERFTGARAEQWGLAYAAVPLDELPATATVLARTVAGKAPLSLAKMKAALADDDSPIERVMQAEARELMAIMDTEDWAEGVTAFAHRRIPIFRGR